MAIVTIDVREKELINLARSSGFEYNVKQLDLGDVLIDCSGVVFVVERKTLDDLSASIVDGRYRNQQRRLKDAVAHGWNALYVVEGITKRASGVPMATVRSCMVSCTLKHKIPVLRTSGVEETLHVIATIAKKGSEYADGRDVAYEPSRRSSVKDPQLEALCCAHGVSTHIASSILSKYSSIANIVQEFATHGDTALCSVYKVGPLKSKALYALLMK